MTNDTPQQAPAKAGDQQAVAAKLQARSAAIALHSSNHGVVMNSGFAWR